MLERWWINKYRLPPNHELFSDRTVYDLLVEFFEDTFEKNPLEAYRTKDGKIVFTDTGDELVDSWEQRIAKGESVDLWESFTPEAKAYVQKFLDQKNAAPPRSFKDVVDAADKHQKRLIAEQHPKSTNIPLTFGDGS